MTLLCALAISRYAAAIAVEIYARDKSACVVTDAVQYTEGRPRRSGLLYHRL